MANENKVTSLTIKDSCGRVYTIEGIQGLLGPQGPAGPAGKDGKNGKDSYRCFTSNIFARTKDNIYELHIPEGGSIDGDMPTSDDAVWYDGIPEITSANPGTKIWMSSRFFTEDPTYMETSWSVPKVMADSADFDVCYSNNSQCPPLPDLNTHPAVQNGLWHNFACSDDIWMATSLKSAGGSWSSWNVTRILGEEGTAVFNSIVFRRSSVKPSKPEGGSFESPYPTDTNWEDGIPDIKTGGSASPQVWTSRRTFFSKEKEGQSSEWSEPVLCADSADFDVCYHAAVEDSIDSEKYALPEAGTNPENYNGWHNVGHEEDVWMATNYKSLGSSEWVGWKITKIKGEDGLSVYTVETKITYCVSDLGSTPPDKSENWIETFPMDAVDGKFVWCNTYVLYSDNTETNTYSVSKIGIDGRGVEECDVDYAVFATNALKGEEVQEEYWQEHYPTENILPGYWLYTRTTMKYGNSSDLCRRYDIILLGTGVQVALNEYYIAGPADQDGYVYFEEQPSVVLSKGISSKVTLVEDSTDGKKWYKVPIVDTVKYGVLSNADWKTFKDSYFFGLWYEGVSPGPDVKHGNYTRWNFEATFDADGRAYVTKPSPEGNLGKGIATTIEMYAVYNKAILPGEADLDLKDKIDLLTAEMKTHFATISDEEGVKIGSSKAELASNPWSDESWTRITTDAHPYLWNWTQVTYTDESVDNYIKVAFSKGDKGDIGETIDLKNDGDSIGTDSDLILDLPEGTSYISIDNEFLWTSGTVELSINGIEISKVTPSSVGNKSVGYRNYKKNSSTPSSSSSQQSINFELKHNGGKGFTLKVPDKLDFNFDGHEYIIDIMASSTAAGTSTPRTATKSYKLVGNQKGLDAVMYSLLPSTSHVLVDKVGNTSPASISASVLKKVGNSAYDSVSEDYLLNTLHYEIKYGLNESNSLDDYESYLETSNIINDDLKSIEFYLIDADNNDFIIDKESIPIIRNGLDGDTVDLLNDNVTIGVGSDSILDCPNGGSVSIENSLNWKLGNNDVWANNIEISAIYTNGVNNAETYKDYILLAKSGGSSTPNTSDPQKVALNNSDKNKFKIVLKDKLNFSTVNGSKFDIVLKFTDGEGNNAKSVSKVFTLSGNKNGQDGLMYELRPIVSAIPVSLNNVSNINYIKCQIEKIEGASHKFLTKEEAEAEGLSLGVSIDTEELTSDQIYTGENLKTIIEGAGYSIAGKTINTGVFFQLYVGETQTKDDHEYVQIVKDGYSNVALVGTYWVSLKHTTLGDSTIDTVLVGDEGWCKIASINGGKKGDSCTITFDKTIAPSPHKTSYTIFGQIIAIGHNTEYNCDTVRFTYTGHTTVSDGENGKDGKSESGRTIKYLLTADYAKPSATPETNWKDTQEIPTSDKPYSWKKTEIIFDDGSKGTAIIELVGIKGVDGDSFEALHEVTSIGSTNVAGGLILSSVLALGDVEHNSIHSGLSGLDTDGVLLWGGGTYAEACNAAITNNKYCKSGNTGDKITTLLKDDGTGKIGEFIITDNGGLFGPLKVDKTNSTMAVIDGSNGNKTLFLNSGEISVLQLDNEKIIISPHNIISQLDPTPFDVSITIKSIMYEDEDVSTLQSPYFRTNGDTIQYKIGNSGYKDIMEGLYYNSKEITIYKGCDGEITFPAQSCLASFSVELWDSAVSTASTFRIRRVITIEYLDDDYNNRSIAFSQYSNEGTYLGTKLEIPYNNNNNNNSGYTNVQFTFDNYLERFPADALYGFFEGWSLNINVTYILEGHKKYNSEKITITSKGESSDWGIICKTKVIDAETASFSEKCAISADGIMVRKNDSNYFIIGNDGKFLIAGLPGVGDNNGEVQLESANLKENLLYSTSTIQNLMPILSKMLKALTDGNLISASQCTEWQSLLTTIGNRLSKVLCTR